MPSGNFGNIFSGHLAKQMGLRPLHWSVDPQDWDHPPAKTIIKRVKGATRHGSVVLMHDAGGDRQGTVDALYRILPDLTARFDLHALPKHGT